MKFLHNKLPKNCYGCGVCEIMCPQKLIRIVRSRDGFYAPILTDETKCKNCDLCKKVCSYQDAKISAKNNFAKGYAAYSKDKETLKSSSSGAIGYEIGKLFINKGYKVCGVKYNYDDQRAEHFIANNILDLDLTKGSKYIQSYTVAGFKQLNSTDKWVVFGTPCQIDSIRRWIKLKRIEKNYVLVDIFCHGVPSYLLWERYITHQSKKHKLKRLQNVNFKDKKFGWHSHIISLSDGSKKISNSFKKFDLFFSFFLGDVCLNLSCYENCKYKNVSSSADIRIGDLWGNKYKNNSEGVSGVVAFNDKGERIIEELKKGCVINNESLDIIIAGQVKGSIKTPFIRKKVLKDLANKNVPIKFIFMYAILPKMIFVIIPKAISSKLLSLIK